ncbi:MAG: integrase arm-type DNA-binding domain-containing protein [Proteobacteria bacterium]|nr:integrase arm-type DNA-binding domain-containing protein [Pseudomonadota bacterium]
MPEIAPNVLTVKARLKGEPAVYQIKGSPGLHLAVLGGGRGSWRLRYRPRRGALQRWHTIGDAQTIELGDAITKARELLAGLQLDGVDPKAAADKEAAAKLTFADVYKEWLDNPGRKRTLRARTREEYERIFKAHVEKRIGSTKIALLDKQTVKAKIEEIRKTTTDLKRGHRGLQATKSLTLVRMVCRYALQKEYCDRDPTFGIDRPVPDAHPDGKQNRPPTNDELKLLWKGADMMRPQTARAFKLIVLLGKRVGEILGALKSEVDLGENASLFIPGTREGNKSRENQRVPLPPLARKLIEEQIAESEKSPFLFPGDPKMRRIKKQGHDKVIPMSRHTPSHALRELSANLGIAENVRLHDMRGLIVDQLAAMRVPAEYRSHVLHHTGDMKATLASRAYTTHDFMDEKRRALELWEKRLLEIVEGKKPSGLRW